MHAAGPDEGAAKEGCKMAGKEERRKGRERERGEREREREKKIMSKKVKGDREY